VSEPGLERFVLRPAALGDLPAVSSTLIAAGVEAWGPWLDAERIASQTTQEHEWLAAGGLVVADDAQGVVAGFVRFDVAADGTGWIDLLYTHPRAWGHGAGRALLAHGTGALRDAGCPCALLFTEERNARARGVYEAAGFRLDGEVRERDWHGARLRELRYRLAL